jgi:hypothetical protein
MSFRKKKVTWRGYIVFMRGELQLQMVVIVLQVLFVLYPGVSGA